MLKQGSGSNRVSGGLERSRVLLAAAAWPVLTGYAAIAAVLTMVSALATEAPFSPQGILLAAGPGWLAAYQVPISIDGHELGLLPLVATMGVFALVARSANGAAERLGYSTPQDAIPVVGTIASAHALVGVTIAVLANGSKATPEPLAAFGIPAFFAASAATCGLAGRCGLIASLRDYVDDAAAAGMRAAILGMACLLASGAVVLTVASVLSAPTMRMLFETNAPGFGSGFGMLLLSIAYLPNAVLICVSFAVGPGFSFGSVWVSPFGFDGGAVPGVPLLAGMPDGYAGWWPVLFALPVATGAMVGWKLRASSPVPLERLRSVGVAGALIGFACVVLGSLAGGGLGSGQFTGVVVPVGFLSLAAFSWIALPGGLVTWFAGERPDKPAGEPDVEDAEDGESASADAEGTDAEDTDAEDTDAEEAGEPDEAKDPETPAEDEATAQDAEPGADEGTSAPDAVDAADGDGGDEDGKAEGAPPVEAEQVAEAKEGKPAETTPAAD